MSDQNKAVVERILEAFNEGTPEALDELVAPDFVGHMPLLPEEMRGPEGAKGFFAATRAAMPDCCHPAWTLIAEGDLVVTQMALEGTFTNEFMGMPPNGEKVSVEMANVWKVVDGKAVEWWVNMDTLGFMQQIGAIPSWVNEPPTVI
jgi:steroid delta-isomerase-like uncharacterized protein